MSAIGVDIGGSKIVAAVVRDGEVLARVDRMTPERSTAPDVVLGVIAEAVRELMVDHPVAAVGVGAAGFVDATRRRVMFAPHLSWRDEPLADRLEEALGVPVLLDNDANTTLWGEQRFGAAAGARNAVMVTLGTGIGGALLVDGVVHRGHGGMAGEFGHMQVVPDGRPCECGRTGCWEQYSSGKALMRFSAEAGRPQSGPQITEAARGGDTVALGAFEYVGRWLGVGLANVIAALDPEVVVVGGGVSTAGELLLAPARVALAERLVAAQHRQVPALVPAGLGALAGVVGAADMADRA